MGTRRLTLVLLLLIFIGGVYFYRAREPAPEFNEMETGVEHRLEEFQLIEDTGDNQQWVLRSAAALRKGNRVVLDSPRIVYQEAGDTLALIRAREGRYDLASRLLELKGEVVLERRAPVQTLRTEQLLWDAASGILSTEARLHLEFTDGVLTGRGLWADLEEERLQLKSEVEYHSN